MTYLVTLDGVLRSATGSTIPDGLSLLGDLAVSGRVFVATDGSRLDAETWLKQNGLTSLVMDVVGNEIDHPAQTLRAVQAAKFREGRSFLVVVEPDPEVAQDLIRNGITVALFAKATYQHPRHRLAAARRASWNDLVQGLDAQQDISSSYSEYE